MSRFLLHHRHTAGECRVVFASFKGFARPLRHRAAVGSCACGGHELGGTWRPTATRTPLACFLATWPSAPREGDGRRLAAAVLIDATLIRGVLLPAGMKLLGDRTWYLPRLLHWTPLGRRRAAQPEPARA